MESQLSTLNPRPQVICLEFRVPIHIEYAQSLGTVLRVRFDDQLVGVEPVDRQHTWEGELASDDQVAAAQEVAARTSWPVWRRSRDLQNWLLRVMNQTNPQPPDRTPSPNEDESLHVDEISGEAGVLVVVSPFADSIEDVVLLDTCPVLDETDPLVQSLLCRHPSAQWPAWEPV